MKLGLTLWSHNHWQNSFYGKGTKPAQRLAKYASVFNTVEGNTTFYATPSHQTVLNWYSATGDDFRFTFKLPKSITHEKMLSAVREDTYAFLKVMEPLSEKIGQWTIQLPAAFTFEHFGRLKKLHSYFPANAPLGVEVRHKDFFAKGQAEAELNRWLIENSIDRIIMDSRPVFAAPPTSEAVIDAHRKKPQVPVHAIATGQRPVIRFIGHPDLTANFAFFQPWLTKIPLWIEQGIEPYLMIHTPDNVLAPELAVELYQQLQQATSGRLKDLKPFPAHDDLSTSQFDLFYPNL
ncbi:DUF72 domain-containing protein [Vibrio agarivorans]|uniref:DUF72 domain-containing protein n=1 Tax=Vibrio agarivorans TaxID=153622 RepID=A0ABT7Y3Z3_9VIBR|nr:DUF72 domain-containing protein [Vibrio agarivorans]MDN2482772.1 DUF72 domain-containing protein [Vibrio agarivorans]